MDSAGAAPQLGIAGCEANPEEGSLAVDQMYPCWRSHRKQGSPRIGRNLAALVPSAPD